jgi:hypothetical protein
MGATLAQIGGFIILGGSFGPHNMARQDAARWLKTAGAGGTSAFVVWKLNAIAKCPDKRPQWSNRSGRDRPEVDLRQLVKSCQPPIFNFTALSAPRRVYLPGAAFVQGQPMKKLMLVTLAFSFVKPAAAGQ